jgi:threonyl-tRNA synthetase
MIKITLPDGSVREYAKGTTVLQIAESISQGLAREVLCASVNDEIQETNYSVEASARLRLHTAESGEGKSTLWHSSAHVLAEAIQSLYPEAKFTIGPPIENGFYYDIDFGDEVLSEKDFQKIENTFLELARQKNVFTKTWVSKQDALAYYTAKQNPYKIELIEGLEDGKISFYQQGSFYDLCKGPHIPHTGFIKAVKILNVAGAYWRGNEKNKQLTRVYAVSFTKQKDLDAHLLQLEEAKARDHRKLGKEMELFAFSAKVGQGLPLWLPKGAELRLRLQHFMEKAQQKAGYDKVMTPHIGQKELYVCSGHYEKYGADSFQPIHTPAEGEEFLLKPMNCPHHCEIYKTKPRSYKDLPVRLAEFGTVYRYEQSGELHGLTRVRGFTQDDAHIFCMQEQVKEEFKKVIHLVLYVFKTLGFTEYTAQISLRDPANPSKYIGSDENWNKAETAIIEAAAEENLKTVVEYGEAAFYGPKLDFMVKDAIGRRWQLGTIQVDYNLPERFELEYMGADGQKHRPVMIHRAPFGSMERFIAVLLEHCKGDFPLWLAPNQVQILPISEKYHDYAEEIKQTLLDNDVRAEIDMRAEKIGKKIRDAELSKAPFMLVVGEEEATNKTLSVRQRKVGDLGAMPVAQFAYLVQDAVKAELS